MSTVSGFDLRWEWLELFHQGLVCALCWLIFLRCGGRDLGEFLFRGFVLGVCVRRYKAYVVRTI